MLTTAAAIQTLLYPYELETRLKNLLQTAESAIQEMGANILYLIFSFLEWFDNDNAFLCFWYRCKCSRGGLIQSPRHAKLLINSQVIAENSKKIKGLL